MLKYKLVCTIVCSRPYQLCKKAFSFSVFESRFEMIHFKIFICAALASRAKYLAYCCTE